MIYYYLIVAAGFLFMVQKFIKKPQKRIIYLFAFLYGALVLRLTIFPIPPQWDPNQFHGDYGNFIPFYDLKMGYGGALKDIILNILMTIPFGILAPYIKKAGLITTVISGAFLSIIIESTQMLMTFYGSPYHAFDVTDIITNTAGSLIGYGFYQMIKRIK